MSDTVHIGANEVRHMAQLSRLLVSSEEEALFAKQFEKIVGYMDVLRDIDVTNVEPLYSPVSHTFTPRKDIATRTRTHDEILQNAPKKDDTYFVVPRIV